MSIDESTLSKRNIIGNMLRIAREKTGLTQAAVARMLRYRSAQFISNWERGVSLPPLEVFPKLSKIYGLSPRTIMLTMERYHEDLVKSRNNRLRRLLEKAKVRA